MLNSLKAGAVPARLPQKRSQAHTGIQPLSTLTHRTQRFQQLPAPLGEPPYHYGLETSFPEIAAAVNKQGKLVLHAVGDTGGIKNGEFQADVAKAMKDDLNLPQGEAPNFFYHLGDVIYYNGEISKYYDQFYEPYNHYTAPIFAIPGNHDGDPINNSQVSLDGWVRYFMSPTAQVRPESQDAPRVTLSEPNVYFTLDTPFATFVGMYTNVPEGGSVDSVQQQWLTNEFATAPVDKAFILALHHPIYSFDDYHSGSPAMAKVVAQAINDSRRVPNMVLTAHVHNYQRIERVLFGKKSVPFMVMGNGGYYNLHGLNAQPGDKDAINGAHLISANDQQHGYSILTIDKQNISGVANLVGDSKSAAKPNFDRFSYPVAAVKLGKNDTVSL